MNETLKCEKHCQVFAPDLCPICLIEERDRLRAERDRLAEWVARLETEHGRLHVKAVRLSRALIQVARIVQEIGVSHNGEKEI